MMRHFREDKFIDFSAILAEEKIFVFLEVKPYTKIGV